MKIFKDSKPLPLKSFLSKESLERICNFIMTFKGQDEDRIKSYIKRFVIDLYFRDLVYRKPKINNFEIKKLVVNFINAKGPSQALESLESIENSFSMYDINFKEEVVRISNFIKNEMIPSIEGYLENKSDAGTGYINYIKLCLIESLYIFLIKYSLP